MTATYPAVQDHSDHNCAPHTFWFVCLPTSSVEAAPAMAPCSLTRAVGDCMARAQLGIRVRHVAAHGIYDGSRHLPPGTHCEGAVFDRCPLGLLACELPTVQLSTWACARTRHMWLGCHLRAACVLHEGWVAHSGLKVGKLSTCTRLQPCSGCLAGC